MPALRSTNQRAEAKYNVTTEFPSLGLHSAAASGDVGLVEYALNRGQPVNSVIDGVLPLHAACSGGSEQVVKVLLDYGADVNAPRLPRRYSNEKNRDGTPMIGTSGSTPLHFASANGNTNIVDFLLRKGARADRADKHGITPEMLARQNGWLECADTLRDWVQNKDRDLRDRQVPRNGRPSREDSFSSRLSSGPTSKETSPDGPRKRVQVKRSIDTALNMLKASSSGLSEAYHRSSPSSKPIPLSSSPPASPIAGSSSKGDEPAKFGEYTWYPVPDNGNPSPIDPNARRPSLPHIMSDESQMGHFADTSASGLRKSSRIRGSRRPRSAGNDAEPEHCTIRGSSGRVVGTKSSLKNFFHKRSQDSNAGTSVGSMSKTQASSSTVSLASAQSQFGNEPMSRASPPQRRSSHRRHRMGSDATRQNQQLMQNSLSATPNSSRPHLPLAVDLHNAMASAQSGRSQGQRSHSRDRSASAGSGNRFDIPTRSAPIPIASSSSATRSAFESGSFKSGSVGSWGTGSPGSFTGSSPIHRLGALRERARQSGRTARERSSSRSKLTPTEGDGGSPTLLRSQGYNDFDGGAPSSLSNSSLKVDSSSSVLGSKTPPSLAGLRSTSSISSLPRSGSSLPIEVIDENSQIPESAPPGVAEFDMSAGDEVDDDEDYSYGRPLDDPLNMKNGVTPLTTINRHRGSSFASSEGSLSPIMANESSAGDYGTAKPVHSDFPFSISGPPAIAGSPPSGKLLSANDAKRGRGDSLSSVGTSNTSGNDSPLLSASGISSTGSATMTTPSVGGPRDDNQAREQTPDEDRDGEVGIVVQDSNGQKTDVVLVNAETRPAFPGSFKDRRPNAPEQILIVPKEDGAGSDEALKRVEQEILTHQSESTPGSSGWTPLSARLAAYGEALEKKQRVDNGKQAVKLQYSAGFEREPKTDEDKQSPLDSLQMKLSNSSSSASSLNMKPPRSPRRPRNEGDRQRSLETPSTVGRGQPRRSKIPRRPHTSDGPGDGSQTPISPSGMEVGRFKTHHPRSASAVDSPTIEDEDFDPPKTAVPLQSQPSTAKTVADPSLSQPTDEHDGPLTDDYRNRIASLDITDGDTDVEFGAPLARISTAPHMASSVSKRDPLISARSHQKLTRMGFNPSNEMGSARNPSASSNAKKFGGLKSWVASFKGRS